MAWVKTRQPKILAKTRNLLSRQAIVLLLELLRSISVRTSGSKGGLLTVLEERFILTGRSFSDRALMHSVESSVAF